MTDKVLFTFTEENLETGLRGVPVGYCTTSSVHPEKGLYYIDRPIAEVAFWEPERAIFLLYKGYDGTAQEIEAFKKDLQKRSSCSKEAIQAIEALPRNGNAMACYSAAILLLGMFELTSDWREDCLNLIAKIPVLTAVVINQHAGWGKTPHSRPELGYMENFAHMLNVPHKHPEFATILRFLNILQYDHGGGNLSTFVGKAVASGLEDIYGSIAAAINALAGSRHGSANQNALHFVEEVARHVGNLATEKDVENYIRKKLEQNELIFGFGHAVLRVEDPRATLLYEYAEKHFKEHPLVKIASMIRSAGSKVLKENPKIASPYPNVDAISGVVLSAAQFSYPEYYTVLFGLARTVGIAIQIVYERCEARGGKGTPIIRPKYIYKSR